MIWLEVADFFCYTMQQWANLYVMGVGVFLCIPEELPMCVVHYVIQLLQFLLQVFFSLQLFKTCSIAMRTRNNIFWFPNHESSVCIIL